MKKRSGIFLVCLLFFTSLNGDSYPVNTQNSSFAGLKTDDCEYDEETDIVHCTKTGTFQKVTKGCDGKNAAQNQLIGTITVDKKACNLYAISPQQALDQNRSVIVIAEKIAATFQSSRSFKKPPKPNPFPTTSMNAQRLMLPMDASGLN